MNTPDQTVAGHRIESAGRTPLKDVFKDDFYIGAALSLDQISGKEPEAMALVAKQFNTITPENILKWEEVHPQPDRYNFEPVDRYVAFGEKHKMHIIGHALVWWHQTPDWVFQDPSGKPLGREALLQRFKPESVKKAVQNGLGIAYISAFAVGTELRAKTLLAVKIQNLRIQRELKIVYRKDKHLSPAAKAFLEASQAEVQR